MAVNEITGSTSILFSTLGSLQGTLLRRAPIDLQGEGQAATRAAQSSNAFQQNAQLVSISPQNVAVPPAPSSPLLPLTEVAATPASVTILNADGANVTPTVTTPPAELTTARVAPNALTALIVIAPAPLQIPVTSQNAGPLAPSQVATGTARQSAVQGTITAPTIIQPQALQVNIPLQNVTAARETILPAPSPAVPSATSAAPAVAAALTAPAPEAIQQNALLVNEALRNLGFTATAPTETVFFTAPSPLLTALLETGELSPSQQSALLVNQTLQNLNFTPAEQRNPLLINELPPALEAAGITDELDLLNANALLINETLLDVGLPGTNGATGQVPLPAAQGLAAAANLADAAAAQNLSPLPRTEPALLTPAATPITTIATTPTTAVTETPIPVTAAFQTPGLTPATFPLTLFPDRTPYPLIVFQPNDPAPLPRPPAPIDREVPPTTPVTPTRALGDARLRQLRLRQGGGGLKNAEYFPGPITRGQAEKSIRYTLGQVNADMAAQGSPLHLVFARHEDGFALDVYDCSYNEACRLAYDVPIPLDNLPGVLGNLQHETGIIVDTTS